MLDDLRPFLLSALLASAVPAPAQAQNMVATPPDALPKLPDPATIEVPDVTPSSDPKVREDGYKFYYFHNPDVAFAEAYQDLKECRGFLSMGGYGPVPGFVPWDDTHRREDDARLRPKDQPINLIGMIIVPKIDRGQRSNKMRRCMGTRGYARYAIPEATWIALNEGKDEEKMVLMQARLASGPAPKDEVVIK